MAHSQYGYSSTRAPPPTTTQAKPSALRLQPPTKPPKPGNDAMPPPSPPPNPRKWRFTWESLAHIPTLRLFLLDPRTNPRLTCKSIAASLSLPRSLVVVTWSEETGDGASAEVVLGVPLPGVFVDPASPVGVRALDDHIEVKLALVLPVDHPLVAVRRLAFGELNGLSDGEKLDPDLGLFQPLKLESDISKFSSAGGVDFYCRNCSAKLTKNPISSFVEMPSVNWREAADNWFGGCCCSFGGISEKLVSKYANSYSCMPGTCLLDDTSVTICKNDLLASVFEDSTCDTPLVESLNSLSLFEKSNCLKLNEEEVEQNLKNGLSISEPKFSAANHDHCCFHNSETSGIDNDLNQCGSFNQGPLGSSFMINSSDLCSDIQWIEFVCSRCSCPLGSYPSVKDALTPADGGVRFFKCYLSTSLPVGESDDIFRKHTLQRVFINQLLKSADDELSFRTTVKDLKTKSMMLQIVLLNSKVWCCTDNCFDDKTEESSIGVNLIPVVKLLFSDCSASSEAEVREIEEWAAKSGANEVYMMNFQIMDLIQSLKAAQNNFPNSCSSLEGLAVSYLER